jgi:hypothetical protein
LTTNFLTTGITFSDLKFLTNLEIARFYIEIVNDVFHCSGNEQFVTLRNRSHWFQKNLQIITSLTFFFELSYNVNEFLSSLLKFSALNLKYCVTWSLFGFVMSFLEGHFIAAKSNRTYFTFLSFYQIPNYRCRPLGFSLLNHQTTSRPRKNG